MNPRKILRTIGIFLVSFVVVCRPSLLVIESCFLLLFCICGPIVFRIFSVIGVIISSESRYLKPVKDFFSSGKEN